MKSVKGDMVIINGEGNKFFKIQGIDNKNKTFQWYEFSNLNGYRVNSLNDIKRIKEEK